MSRYGKWQRLKDILSGVKRSFRLRKHTLQPSTLELLKHVYPDVNWSRVDFYEGLPWFTPFIAPYVTAQALPQFYSFGKFRIYLRKFDESRAQCLADIVHEGFHIMQGMHFWKGYGFGFLRGIMVYYNAFYLTHGYRKNPFEVPAYEQEFRFLEFCEVHGIHGIKPKVDPKELRSLIHQWELVRHDYYFRYSGNGFALVASFFFCLLVALVKPLADLLVFIIGLFMGEERVFGSATA
jgi:hypothetical protein